MHTSPANQRRRQCARRRDQIRRRRVVALVVSVTLISFAIWVAYAIPGQTPARVPADAAAPTFVRNDSPGEAVVVARVEGLDVLLPVAQAVTTAVAFHPVDNPNTVPFAPVGKRLGGGDLGQRLADVFAVGGGVQYFLMDGRGDKASSSTSGLDIGAVPGSPIVSPVHGKVVAIRRTRILGRYPDIEMDIRLTGEPSLNLVVSHIEKPKVAVGDVVKSGDSILGAVRGFPATLDQALSQFTSDSGDHVQLVMLRVTPQLAGL